MKDAFPFYLSMNPRGVASIPPFVSGEHRLGSIKICAIFFYFRPYLQHLYGLDAFFLGLWKTRPKQWCLSCWDQIAVYLEPYLRKPGSRVWPGCQSSYPWLFSYAHETSPLTLAGCFFSSLILFCLTWLLLPLKGSESINNVNIDWLWGLLRDGLWKGGFFGYVVMPGAGLDCSCYFASNLHRWNLFPFFAILRCTGCDQFLFVCLFFFSSWEGFSFFFDCFFQREESAGSMRLILDSISLGALMIYSDAVHELHVDMSIYGVILCLFNGFNPGGFPEPFNDWCLPVGLDYGQPSALLLKTAFGLPLTADGCRRSLVPIWSDSISIRHASGSICDCMFTKLSCIRLHPHEPGLKEVAAMSIIAGDVISILLVVICLHPGGSWTPWRSVRVLWNAVTEPHYLWQYISFSRPFRHLSQIAKALHLRILPIVYLLSR